MSNLIGYVRVSTVEQNLDRQLEELERQGVLKDNIYADKASGKDLTERQEFQRMLREVKKGQMIVVSDLSRVGRNLCQVHGFIKDMIERGVAVKLLKEGQTIDGKMNPQMELYLNLMASFADFQRTSMLEAQAEGIIIARRHGKYKGRQQVLSQGDVVNIKADIAKGIPKTVIARNYKIHLRTLYLTLDRFDKGLCVAEVKKRKEGLEQAGPDKDMVKYLRRKQIVDMEKAKEVADVVMSLTKPTPEKIRLLLGARTQMTTHHIECVAKALMEIRKRWAS